MTFILCSVRASETEAEEIEKKTFRFMSEIMPISASMKFLHFEPFVSFPLLDGRRSLQLLAGVTLNMRG